MAPEAFDNEGASPAEGGGSGNRASALAQDIAELLPSLTIIGILLVVFRLHHRLIWGNLLGGQFHPAKPLAAPGVWAGLLGLLDLLLLGTLLFIAIILYMLTNPCEVFANTVIPVEFSYVRSTMERVCPDALLLNATGQ